MTKTNKLTGVITALATPFLKGEIDYESLKRLLRAQLDQGVHGFVVNGTTAESPTLTKSEVRQIFDFVKGEVAGAVPLIVGTGSNSTAVTREMTREVASWGADAVLVVVPYYNRPPQRGLAAHFAAVAGESTLPVILYNVPSRTVASLEPATVGELSRVDNIIGIKDATGDMRVLESIRSQSGPGFICLSGDDGSFVDFCARGGNGVISVSSHIIGSDMIRFMNRAWEGDGQSHIEFTAEYGDFMKHLYIEPNPIPLKMALHLMGIFTSPEMRLPLVALDKKFHKDFEECLRKLALI